MYTSSGEKMFLALYMFLGERQPLIAAPLITLREALELCIKLIIHVAYS